MPSQHSQISRLDDTELLLKSSFRTMAVFEYFADIQRPAYIHEIATALNIPQSSTSTLISSLVDTGYLTKNMKTRTYTPSMRINYLNAWRGDRYPFAANFSKHLKSLHQESGETAVLAMRNGIYSQYILVQHSHEVLRKHVETGSVRPLVCSATGWSLLANEDDHEIKKLINRTVLSVKNKRWIKSSKDALHHIKTVRRLGYAWSDGEAANGASGLAMSIPNELSPVCLSIAIAGPKSRMNEKKNELVVTLKNFVVSLPKSFTTDVLI